MFGLTATKETARLRADRSHTLGQRHVGFVLIAAAFLSLVRVSPPPARSHHG
jgi:hypothetical protein